MIYPAAFYLWNIVAVLTLGWGLLLPRCYVLPLASFWARGHLAVMRWTLGLRFVVEGRAHLPDGPVIIAAKHQSAWETIAFNAVFHQPAFVLKRELFRIPGIGWWLWRAGNIGIDRRAGAAALKTAVRGARARLGEGRAVVIFPEGTRTVPGERRRYQPGVAAIYADSDAPILPVAHNAGLFWPARGLPRRGGVITVSILPLIPPGLERKAMMAQLETAIETRADALAAR